MVREAFGQVGGRLVLLGNVLDSARFLQHGIKLLLLLACLAGWTRSYEIGRRFFFWIFFFEGQSISLHTIREAGWKSIHMRMLQMREDSILHSLGERVALD